MKNKQCWALLSTWYYWTQVVATQVNGSVSYIEAHKKYNWTIAPSTLGLKGDGLIHLYDYDTFHLSHEHHIEIHKTINKAVGKY